MRNILYFHIMSDQKHGLIYAIFSMRCPKCRQGKLFVNRSVFPLSQAVKMHDDCQVCGQRFKNESNNGPGINYALTVMIFFLNLCWYWPIFGITYRDYSIYYYMITSTVVVILLQPWLMRLSRVLYLYMYLAFKE